MNATTFNIIPNQSCISKCILQTRIFNPSFIDASHPSDFPNKWPHLIDPIWKANQPFSAQQTKFSLTTAGVCLLACQAIHDLSSLTPQLLVERDISSSFVVSSFKPPTHN